MTARSPAAVTANSRLLSGENDRPASRDSWLIDTWTARCFPEPRSSRYSPPSPFGPEVGIAAVDPSGEITPIRLRLIVPAFTTRREPSSRPTSTVWQRYCSSHSTTNHPVGPTASSAAGAGSGEGPPAGRRTRHRRRRTAGSLPRPESRQRQCCPPESE